MERSGADVDVFLSELTDARRDDIVALDAVDLDGLEAMIAEAFATLDES